MVELLQSIADDIRNIFEFDIETSKTDSVPSRDDAGLTFPIGEGKKGKLIETCVLFIDIRNSTFICRRLKKDKVRLGKIYEAFIYAMTRIADEFGYVRNIVGDRVMVVFEPGNCFLDAFNCASIMYTVAMKILDGYVAIPTFKVGIGIDYGELLVLKTGIVKRHEERSEYKGLVWVGDAANVASKLTDFAGKEYSASKYQITYEHHFWYSGDETDYRYSHILPHPYSGTGKGKWLKYNSSAELNDDDLKRKITIENGVFKYSGETIIQMDKSFSSGTTSPILISGAVYEGIKAIDPKLPGFANFSKKNYPQAPSVDKGIYGGHFIDPSIKQIKIA